MLCLIEQKTFHSLQIDIFHFNMVVKHIFGNFRKIPLKETVENSRKIMDIIKKQQ